MKINNKEFGEWTEDDLQVLLSNDAYRENNFIDYKVNFAPLIDKSNKKEKQAEFRNDVCSFANADGGYIFYGIGETSGVASILAGISIPNIDRFELDRRNELQAIRPTVPDVAFSFISFMDKDVETDVIPYPQYGNQEDIQRYHDHSRFLKFLPYTPEVLLVKTYIERKQQFLQSLRAEYSNQQVDYSIAEQLDFTAYEAALPNFSNQTQYNSKIEERGSFRKKCKQVAEKIALELSQQLNITVKEVYRYSYKFAVENIPENELNVRALLAQTMKRVR